MCRVNIGCGRLLISVTLWFPIIEEFLEWPTPCGQRNAVGGLGAARFRMQHCGMSLQADWRVCHRCTQLVRVHDARLWQMVRSWAHHGFCPSSVLLQLEVIKCPKRGL